MEDSDPNKLRDIEIKRLAEMAEPAYRNSMDEDLKNENKGKLIPEVHHFRFRA